ncbi:hypothetical protein [Aurantiacibacter rhizosphaerae]|uniref:Uncharacterized protein n=1 Tax=Aurantiacibacter rhizosphaerae TaxID=2691582 RepID=A0A844XFY5_9SPHN|nr:hypothetical protein [Aurantiacibacter rhizosphaerae]MWV28435.1 hypothetical protein [Aurantiacibacter rhizosphaerae]
MSAFDGEDFVPEVRVDLASANGSFASGEGAGLGSIAGGAADHAAFEAKIADAVEDFARVQGEEGLDGAEQFSVNCHQTAKPMNDILWMDYCVAFDFSAWTLDRSFNDHFNTAPYAYFADQVASYQRAESPFAREHPQRIRLIQTLVTQSLFETLRNRRSIGGRPASSQE